MYEINELKERRLYINSEIDDEVIDTIVFHIMNYNREDKGIDAKDRKPIILYINSPGGSVYSGYALISAMQCSKTPIYPVCRKTPCFSYGDIRYFHRIYASN